MEASSVWPVIVGTVSQNESLRFHTKSNAHMATHIPRWAGQTGVLSLEKISARLHNEVDLSVPATPA